MKKKITRGILFILVLIMALCSFSACKKHEEARVGEAVITFIEDFYLNCNFDKALEVCEGEAYDIVVASVNSIKDNCSNAEINKWVETSSFETFKVKTETVNIMGTTAYLDLVIQPQDKPLTKWEYKLEKLNDKWKIVSIKQIVSADSIV